MKPVSALLLALPLVRSWAPATARLARSATASASRRAPPPARHASSTARSAADDVVEFSTPAPTEAELASPDVLYALGVNLASQLAEIGDICEKQEIEDHVLRGISDMLLGKVDGDPKALLQANANSINQLLQLRSQKIVTNAKMEGAAVIEEAKKQPDAIFTASGMVVVPTKKGIGPSPTAASTVQVHYTGKLVDGSVFDSSVARGEPAQFALGQVIAGWKEGLQLLQEGAEATLYIPSDIGYGDAGNPSIPGGATLIFEVQLLKVLSAGVGGLIIP